MTIESRFWSYVDKKKSNQCWNWKGYINERGYGKFHFSKAQNTLPVHRASLLIHGIKLKNGLTVDHLCRNKICVNPKHLEQVTNRINVLRGNTIPAFNSKKTHCVNGHEFTKENTYHFKKNGRVCKICNNNRRKKWKRGN